MLDPASVYPQGKPTFVLKDSQHGGLCFQQLLQRSFTCQILTEHLLGTQACGQSRPGPGSVPGSPRR